MAYTTFLIDLDDTVYASSCGVWDAISHRMEQYMHDRLDLPWEEIPALRRNLYQQYGTTLRGLQETHQVDPVEFVDYVHDVPLDRLLQPDPELRAVLRQYPQRKVVFTNADRKHAARVIRRLGVEDCFDSIIDILDIAPYCKPMSQAFQVALRLLGETNPRHCVFIDDSPRNLAGGREAGFYTIQVGSPQTSAPASGLPAHAVISRLSDLPSVIRPDQ